MLKNLKKLVAALAVAGVACLSGCGNTERAVQEDAGETIVLRYAENQTGDYPTTQAAKKFAELVKEGTQGRIVIDVYDNAKLSNEEAVIKQVMYGSVDMSRVSISLLSEITRDYEVLQLPYLYRDSEHMWKVLDGDIGKDFLRKMEPSGIIGLSWYDAGARNFYTSKKEIKSLEDMKGLNIRVQNSPMMEDLVKALGANPIPMTYGDVYAGLEAGTIDGAENSWPSYESMNHYKVAKYYCLDGHARIPEIQIISKKTMDKLDATDQQILRMCAIESAKYERELWEKREKESEKKAKDGGTVVTQLSESEMAKFVEAVQSVYEKYGRPAGEMVQRIRDVK